MSEIPEYLSKRGWTRDEWGEWIKDGVHYGNDPESPYGTELGFCGCGSNEVALTFVRDMLAHLAVKWDVGGDREAWEGWCRRYRDREARLFGGNVGASYFAYYRLDDLRLTEHGGSVPGWPTEDGHQLLAALVELLGPSPFAEDVPPNNNGNNSG